MISIGSGILLYGRVFLTHSCGDSVGAGAADGSSSAAAKDRGSRRIRIRMKAIVFRMDRYTPLEKKYVYTINYTIEIKKMKEEILIFDKKLKYF